MAARVVRGGRGRAQIVGIELVSAVGLPTAGEPLAVRFRIDGDNSVECSFTIYDAFGDAVTSSSNSTDHSDYDLIGDELSCLCTPLLLRPGRYRINAALTSRDGQMEDHLEGAVMFEVQPGVLDEQLVGAHPGLWQRHPAAPLDEEPTMRRLHAPQVLVAGWFSFVNGHATGRRPDVPISSEAGSPRRASPTTIAPIRHSPAGSIGAPRIRLPTAI